MKFKITYASGLVEEVTTDDTSLDAFVNAKFGSTYAAFLENGGTISTRFENEGPEEEVADDGES